MQGNREATGSDVEEAGVVCREAERRRWLGSSTSHSPFLQWWPDVVASLRAQNLADVDIYY
jgi:hypothetical protein